MRTIRDLRSVAIQNSLFTPTTLRGAIERLGFVQADPIRSPATAQDLILRHRVKGYRAGDLERKYASLDLEEDYLYAYGFLPSENWRWLHPRKTDNLSVLEKKVLSVIREFGAMHPRDLEEHCGVERVINAWGGYSKATTHALDHLHHRGLLRVVRREKGIRVYDAISQSKSSLSAEERGNALVNLMVNILAPTPFKNIQSTRFSKPDTCNTRDTLKHLLLTKKLNSTEVEGVQYLLPAHISSVDEPPSIVRFLAPFDPLVWDRKRFELFWNWSYRFEAYTPIAKRVRGYYALPLLWRDDIIGWANVRVVNGAMDVDLGFVSKRPRDALFKSELEKEIERMKYFLRL
ncbi:MAG: YcaQ family DNA glycosylase [Cyanobacteria bacterium SZAS-4]|nr:YcaQ family DNA glycosylase [Cyanobacteria bacterium SZAS-4]